MYECESLNMKKAEAEELMLFRNMYTVKGETVYRPRLDAWDKRSDLVLWEDLEGASGEGGGRGDQDGEDMWTQGLFISMYDKIHYK